MAFIKVYVRVLALLGPDRWVAIGLALASLALAEFTGAAPVDATAASASA